MCDINSEPSKLYWLEQLQHKAAASITITIQNSDTQRAHFENLYDIPINLINWEVLIEDNQNPLDFPIVKKN